MAAASATSSSRWRVEERRRNRRAVHQRPRCTNVANAASISRVAAGTRIRRVAARSLRAAACTSRQLALGIGGVRVHQHADNRRLGDEFAQQFQSLCAQLAGEKVHARDVTARAVEAGDEAECRPDRRRLRRRSGWSSLRPWLRVPRRDPGDDHGYFAAQSNQPPGSAADRGDLPPSDIRSRRSGPRRSQFRSGPGGTRSRDAARSAATCCARKPTTGICRLLRPRRQRPRRRRAAEQRDELAPLHSITSSARASSVGGTSRPSALAVLRLITSSYLVGACTGRSAGFSPLRMRST